MSLRRTVFPLAGGLNTATPPITLPPGYTNACINYEAEPKGGYTRIAGYELYDGTDSAAAVPGSGPIRGVWVYDGDLYAVRDNAGATAGVMHKAVAGGAGWSTVSLGERLDFDAGELQINEGDTITGASSGATATVDRVVVVSGLWGSANVIGTLAISSVSGTFTDGEDLWVSAVKVAEANGTQTANTLPAGGLYSFVNNNFYGAVTTNRMYGANGVGDAFEFDGTVFVPIPLGLSVYPTLVEEFKGHLVLGFAEGSVQISCTGEPLCYEGSLGAVEIATGDAVEDIRRMTGGVLGISCRQSIRVLYGNDSADFQLQTLNNFGTRGRTLTSIYNDSYVLTDQGIQLITPSQDFGDFRSTSISQFVENDIVTDIRGSATPLAHVSKNKDQYRLFFGRKGYYFTFDGTQPVGIMPVVYDHEVLCVVTGVDASDQEVMFFGSTDGQVFKLESGYTFNGNPINATIQLPFQLENIGNVRKRFRRALFNIRVTGANPTLTMRADFKAFDFDTSGTIQSQLFQSGTGGVLWDEGDWDEVYWADAASDGQAQGRMDGVGQHVTITLFNDGTQAGLYTLYSTTLMWMPRPLLRG